MKHFFQSLCQSWTRLSLVLRICIGLVVGTVLGLCLPYTRVIGILGDLFVWSLKAIAPVLVFVLVSSSLCNANGKLGGRFRTLIARYILTMLLAAMVAIIGSRLFPVTFSLSQGADTQVTGSLGELFDNILLGIVTNPLKAIAEANYLSILFWALLTGSALKLLGGDGTKRAFADLSNVVTQIVKWIIQCAPLGIMGLIYTNISTLGMSVYAEYAHLLLLLVGCMLVSTLVVNPILVAVIMRGNPYPLLWKCLKTSGLPAFFTRSSAANIPVNMQLCEEEGVDKDFYSVAVPLGSTVNMDGAAITITVMTLATCHTLGIEVGFVQSVLLALISAAAACGASGVAGGSLLLIPMACSLFGIGNDVAMQVVAIGFVLGVIQDSVETALNSSCDVLFIIATDLRERSR